MKKIKTGTRVTSVVGKYVKDRSVERDKKKWLNGKRLRMEYSTERSTIRQKVSL